MKSYETIARWLGLFITFAGIVLMIAWMLDLPVIRSINPAWISIKFMTALCFALAGLKLYYLPEYLHGKTQPAQIILSATSLVILLVMATLLISFFFGIRTGIEDFFIREPAGSPSTPLSGSPAIPTMIGFLLIVTTSVLSKLRVPNLRSDLFVLASCIALLGVLPLVGYSFSIPALYYDLPGWGNPMAFLTAFLFVCTGAALIIIAEHCSWKAPQ